MTRLKKFSDFFGELLKRMSLVLLISLSVVIFLKVIARYIFKANIPELIIVQKFAISWLIFLGAAVAVKEKKHLEIDMLSDFLSEKTLKVKELFIDFILVFVTIGLVIIGYSAFISGFGRQELIPISFIEGTISLVYFNSSFFVGAIFMLLFQIENLLESISNYKKSRREAL